MSLIRKHVAVLQAWACLDLVLHGFKVAQRLGLGFVQYLNISKIFLSVPDTKGVSVFCDFH